MKNAKRRRTHLNELACWRATAMESLEQRRLLAVDVVSWHNDAGLTGLNANEQVLTPSNVSSASFGKLFSYAVTGQVYAQPLYVSNIAIPGQGTRNVVFVATMNNDMYAFDADSTSGANGGMLWHVNLGPAAAVPSPYIGFRYGPDHDTTPLVGVTSTPIIDRASGTLYLDSFTNDVAGQDAYSHHIHALDIRTGLDKVAPKLVTASVPGNGVGGNGTTVTFAANRQIQRSALTMHNGVLYVAYAAYADTDPYHGWILGFDPSSLNTISVFNTTPNVDATARDNAEGEGGIWQSGAGLASDGTSVYLETGNGDYNPTYGDFSDSVLRITTDTSTPATPNKNGWGLTVADYFTPYNEQQLADADADLGSAGSLILPDQAGAHPHEMVAIGKQGIIYVLNRDSLGGHTTTADNVLQKVTLGSGFWGSPAYFNSSLYYHAVNDVLKRYSLTNGLLSAAPAAQSSIKYTTWPGATPSVSANGTANGIVWDVQFETGRQILHAYDATTLVELFNSNQNAARDQMGAGVKFITPTIADGHVFVGSTGAVTVYGLIQPVTTLPSAPSALSVTPASGGMTLAWVDNANNENGFKIERSTDGTNFAQIDLVGVDVRNYVDALVAPNTKYYYRVRATNVIGDSSFAPVASATTLPPAGAVNLYHFDAGSGTTAIDSAGGNTGTLVGSPLPQWVAGTSSSTALSFSGNGAYNQPATQSAVATGSDLSGVLGSTSTLALWVQTTQVGTSSFWTAPAITGVDQPSANDIMWGSLDATGHIGLFVGNSGGVSSTSRINDGQWHHVAMTRDATTGRVQIFIDGVLDATHVLDAGNKTTPFSLIGALTVAAADGSRTGANYFNGKLDELRIYNAVLGAGEIAGLARVPAAPVLQSVTAIAGPVVHLSFTSPSGFAESIRISRKVGVDGTFVPIATVSAAATTFDDTNVAAGTAYYYKLEAIDKAGASAPSNILGVTPPIPRVIGMYTFYNRSSFDGQNGTSNLTDRAAIASDKQPLLPGQTSTFQNYTSYSRGLAGIIIDVADMDVLPRIDDFEFKVGNSSDLSTWTQAPTPALINTYPGRGVNGSTQITIIWNDNEIQNEWLRVKVLAQPHLNLAQDVTFYFGNSIGDTGNSTADAHVTSDDASRVAANPIGSAGVTNVFDINRDGVVNSADVDLVNANLTTSGGLQLLSFGTAPTVAVPATASPLAVTGTTTALSVLGTDAAGEAGLTYTWSTIGTPPAPITFSANGTNASKNTIATFSKAGTYQLLVTIKDASQESVTSLVTVQVSQTATSIVITGSTSVPVSTSASFTAIQLDQFGDAMPAQPAFTWSVASGPGSISNAGVYTASRTAGPATITATAGGRTGSFVVNAVDEMLAWYRADVNAGTALADSSGSNQPATLTGAYSFGPGVSGNAITFNGGYANLPTGVVSGVNDFTIATWVKVTTLQQWARIFDFGTGTNNYMMLTPMADSGAIRFAVTNTGNGAEQRVDGPVMTANQWTHIAVTLSGNTATLYLNGVAVASNDAINVHPTNLGVTTQNYLGKSQWADPALQGSIDDFRIYDRALSPSQVAGLAEKSIAIVTPATAGQSPVTTQSTTLSVLASDANGLESGLAYTWSIVGNVPAPVTFSRNGSNAAKNVTASFTAAGTYNFLVTITNAAGIAVTSNVTIVVQQTSSGVKISAPSNTIETGMTLPLTFGTVDQFGRTFGPAVSAVNWQVTSGTGSVSTSGILTAPASAGTVTISASAPGVATDTLTLTIVSSKRAWYQANSTTGNTLTDGSGQNRNGTISGTRTWSAGVSGNALNLNGGFVSLPAGIVSGVSDITIATWVKVSNLANWSRIFDFGNNTDSWMFLTPSAGGTNAMQFAIKTAGNATQNLNGPAIDLNTWTHVAITLAGDVATMYVNGIAVATNTQITYDPAALGNTTANYIGDSQYPADPLLQGSIDDFRIYTRALSAQEVSELALPTIVNAATSSASTVTTTSTTLSALASDVTRGEAALTYTWSVLGTPPAPVSFSANGTNAAKNVTATFTSAGTYTFQVAVAGNGGQAVYSTVVVTVVPTFAIMPAAATVIAGTPVQFAVADQFGGSATAANWSSSAGSISLTGLFIAPSTGAASATITAVVNGTNLSTTVAITSPRGWYKSDTVNGTTLIDDSGNGRAGTLAGSYSYAAGKIGNALNLSGGYASLPTGVITGLDEVTIAAWVNPTSNPAWARIFDFGTGTTSYMFMTANAGGNNALRFAITVGGNGAEQVINGPALATNAWSHVAVTLAANGNGTYTGTLYLNGVAVGTNAGLTLTANSLGNTTANYIGKSQYGDPAYQGAVDDFRIYGVAAPASAIAVIYAAGNASASSAPSNVIAAAIAPSQVRVTWTDNSTAELGYLIERSTSATFTTGLTTFNTSANTSAYTDPSAASGTTYYYRVSAILPAGASAGPAVAPAVTTPALGTVTASRHWYERSPNQLTFTIGTDLGAAAFSASSLIVKRSDGSAITVTGYTYDAATRTATFTLAAGLADGDYLATLAKGTSLVADASLAFFVLTGDVNHDRVVNFADLVILAQNYNKTGKTFAQGNLDGDAAGTVSFSDLVILAQHYNASLPPIAPAISVASTPLLAVTSTTTASKSKRATPAANVEQ